jgi:hypothetical protein
MIPKLIKAKHIRDYVLELTFDDGLSGQVDFKDKLWGPIFVPLKDETAFRAFSIHPDLDTLCWPNGADFSPEFLYESAKRVEA